MSGFVKLDVGMLNSSLWIERDARSLFVTALLMAEPVELTKPAPQLKVRTLEETGWVVPPGYYGLVPSAGVGIIRRDGMEIEEGLVVLERLGAPDPESRSQSFDGRRLVRVDGGYVVLNYFTYREKDHTNKLRQQRFRAKKKRNGVTGQRNTVTVTHADADADATKRTTPAPVVADIANRVEVERVLTEYQLIFPKRKVAGEKLRKLVRSRLADFTGDELIEAIKGNAFDEWHAARKKHELAYVLRDTDQVNRFRALAAPSPKPASNGNHKAATKGIVSW